VHAAFANEVRGLGNPNVRAEVSFLNGRIFEYGTPGSVRVDAVWFTPNNEVLTVFDLKRQCHTNATAHSSNPTAGWQSRSCHPTQAMTKKEFEKIGKALLPELPGFAVKGNLLFMLPVRQVLRGICFEPSGFDRRAFYVNVFVLPLCVPTQYLYFNFGRRVGTGWSSDAPDVYSELSLALRREALPFLSRVEDLDDFIQLAKSFSRANPRTREAIAYALARVGEVDKAIAELDTLLAMLDVKVPWQLEMAERANALKSLLLHDFASAQKQLQEWEAESIRNLGLEKFR